MSFWNDVSNYFTEGVNYIESLWKDETLYEAPIEKLPNEILHSIFWMLENTSDRTALRLVNSHFGERFTSHKLLILEKSAALLAQKVWKRSLTVEERDSMGMGRCNRMASVASVHEIAIRTRNALHYQECLNTFYKEFITFVNSAENPNSSNLLKNSEMAIDILKYKHKWLSKKKESEKNSVNCIKLETAIKDLNKYIFDFLINVYAKQPIENITPESYKAKTNEIYGLFRLTITEIEVLLRSAIRKEHHDTLVAIASAKTGPEARFYMELSKELFIDPRNQQQRFHNEQLHYALHDIIGN